MLVHSPAKPFLQRIASLWRQTRRTAIVKITDDIRLDLLWFTHVIRHGRLRGVPLDMFSTLPEPQVHLYMDASNSGLCVLHPAALEFIASHLTQKNDTLFAPAN